MNHPGYPATSQAARGNAALRFLGAVIVALSLGVGLLPLYGPWLAMGLYEGGPGGPPPPAYVELLMFIPMFAVVLVPLGLVGSAAGGLLLWFGRKQTGPR